MGDAPELINATYLSFATYRNSGTEVATPVWCAEDQGDYFIFSAAQAGKVKRLRNSDQAKLAVCDYHGKLLGEWHPARATLLTEQSEIQRALANLRRKYGWQMWLADLGSKLTGKFNRRMYIKVQLIAEISVP